MLGFEEYFLVKPSPSQTGRAQTLPGIAADEES